MPTDTPMEVDVRTVDLWLDPDSESARSDLALIDCREPSEAEIVKIEGAYLLPLSQIASRLEELQQFRGKHIVVHCHHGGRSLRLAHWLRENGFPDAQSMAGGVDAWAIEIEPGLARY